MTMHKAGATILILFAGAIPFALPGCKHSKTEFTEFSTIKEIDSRAASGALNIEKMGGEIDVESAPHGATLTTMGGDIHLGSVASFAHLKTMGGNIIIGHANASIDATTMGGNITISEAHGALKASTMGGDITARLVGSSSERRDIELISNGGAIKLIVPKDFPMDVRITLAYTKNAPRRYEIVDHVGLAQNEIADWDTSEDSPRKYIRAAGRVGSGLNHVEIRTINGDVILKQE